MAVESMASVDYPGKSALRGAVSILLLIVATVAVAHFSDFSSFVAEFATLQWQPVVVVVLLFTVAALLSGLRLWVIARDLDHPISGRDAVSAVTIGYLAGGLFFQIVGQTIARSMLLARKGIPVAASLVMMGYERFVTVIVAFTLAVSGAWFLFGRLVLDTAHGGGAFLRFATVALLAITAGGALGWGGKLVSALKPMNKFTLFVRFIRGTGISVAIQLCTMAAYVVLAHSVAPEIPLFDLAAATTIVMFAASLPISLAGWGVRELSAVLALSVIGMPAEQALLVAVVIGILSIAVVAILAGIMMLLQWKRPGRDLIVEPVERPRFDLTSAIVWVLPLAAATAVFFQVFVPVGKGNVVNVNMADPVAVLGGVLFAIWAVRDRRWPRWRMSGLNAHVLIICATFVVSFAIGWTSFGWSQWAFTNKLLGLFVLLGYGAMGALVVTRFGMDGYRVLLQTLVGAAMAVVAADIALLLVNQCCVRISPAVFRPQLEGFAQNANAFAFQLILIFSIALVILKQRTLSVAVMAACIVGVWFTSSRSGLATLLAVLLAGFLVADYRRRIVYALLVAGAAIAAIFLTPIIATFFREYVLPILMGEGADVIGKSFRYRQQGMFMIGDDRTSDSERMATIWGGIALFLKNPLFGSGLGAFAEQWIREHGKLQVIHSTPVWLLAEFGVVGTILIAFPFLRLWIMEVRKIAAGNKAALILVLACLALGLFSLAHEMFYQRLFWLIFGASLAVLPAWETGSVTDRPAPTAAHGTRKNQAKNS